MNIKALKKENRKKGFALLFSVLISSLLLTIGLSIFSIALKELAISTAARQSVHAFYAADSGRECALYWDIKKGQIPDLLNSNTGTITCAGKVENLTGGYNGADYLHSTDVIINIPNMAVNNDTIGPNFTVIVKKHLYNRDLPNQSASTTVTSTGYDSAGGDQIEREIQETY